MKKTKKPKGVLHREQGKLAVVERQMDGFLSREEQKPKLVVEQRRRGGSGRATGCRCRMGPTGMGQERRWDWVRENGLGEVGGGEPSSNKAQTEGPEAKQTGPLLLLDLAPKKLCPVQTGLSESPAKKHLNEVQKSCTILPDWKPKRQNKGATPFDNWKEEDRREDQAVMPSLENDDPRYVRPTHEDFSSSKISVFGRPLLMGGSSGQEGPLKLKEIDDLEPLRMVAVDGREWGMESSDTLEVFEEGPGGEGQQGEESVSVESEASGYEKWEDSCLIKFSEYLGFSIAGFESEILDLLSKIVARQHQGENKGPS